LKFLMMEYIGFFADKKPDKTYYFYPKSGWFPGFIFLIISFNCFE
jgi:hypothetical protein